MCGITAWAGKSPKHFNKLEFDTILKFNDSRGGDSVGVATDGEIYYGIDKNKSYENFIINQNYLLPQVVPTVIGHARRQSVGLANIHNAHPFGFGELDEGFHFIGCHNGTLTNHIELAKKYNIDNNVNDENNKFVRSKNDSEILLEILFNEMEIDVLEEYIGGAALVFQNLENPNIIYAFKGASKKETTDVGTLLYEERPLYYYQKSRNSVYISSMIEPLLFIGGIEGENVFDFDSNTLYKIENGNVALAEKIPVDRSKSGQKKGWTNYKSSVYTPPTNTHNAHLCVAYSNYKKKERNKIKVPNIFDLEEIKEYPSAISYYRLRYCRNGHPISGIYTFIPKYGLYYLCDSTQASVIITAKQNLKNKYFSLKKGYFIAESQIDELLKTDDALMIPFPDNKEPSQQLIHDGILYEEMLDYIAVREEMKKFTLEDLSEMSKYPICDFRHRQPNDKQNILFRKELYNETFCPLQSNTNLVIEEGNFVGYENLTVINVSEELQKPATILLPEKTTIPIQINSMSNTDDESVHYAEEEEEEDVIIANCKKIIDFINEDETIEFENNEDIEKLIDKEFGTVYVDLTTITQNLKDNENETVKQFVELGVDFLTQMECLMESMSNKKE